MKSLKDRELTTQKFDLIIIGAGLTGLSAGLAWLKHNRSQPRVLIIEKQSRCGGYVTSYSRKNYNIDTCQLMPDISPVLNYFGLDVKLKKVEQNLVNVFTADTLSGKLETQTVPADLNIFIEQAIAEFPAHANNITTMLRHSAKLYHDLYKLRTKLSALDILKVVVKFQNVIQTSGWTFQQYLEHFDLQNSDFIELLQPFVKMAGLPAEKVAAAVPVSTMQSLLHGAYRFRDRCSELPEKMAARFRELGGDILYHMNVNEVLVENERAVGIQLESGQRLYTENIVSTVDPNILVNKFLVNAKQTKKMAGFRNRVRQLEMTPSVFTINLGMDQDFDPAHYGLSEGYNLLSSGSLCFQELFARYETGENGFDENCFQLGITWKNSATNDLPVLTIGGIPFAPEPWKSLRRQDYKAYRRKKADFADRIIKIVEKWLVPDLSKHIIMTDISTPATYARYSGSPTGSVYDIASTPDNFGLKRLPMKTPVRNLYSPEFVHGVIGSLLSGIQVVDLMLNGKVLGYRISP